MTPFETGAWGALILAVTFAIRLVLLRLWPRDPSDAWFNEYRAALLRKHGRLPRRTPNTDPPTLLSYPWGLTWLFSKLRFSDAVAAGARINIAILLLQTAGTGIAAWVLARHGPVAVPPGPAALLAMGVVAVMPATVSIWWGLHSFTARPAGAFLTALSVFLLILGAVHTPWWYAALPIPVFLLIYLSKFGMQALAFATVGLALYQTSFVPVAAVLASVLLVILISRGGAAWILYGHWLHMRFYATFLQYRHIGTQAWARSPLVILRDALRRRLRLKELMLQVMQTPVLRALVMIPWLIALPLLLEFGDAGRPAIGPLVAVVLVGVVLVVAISLPHLRFLGEADRYLSFLAVSPLAVLVALGTLREGGWAWSLYGALVAVSAAVSAFYVLEGRARSGGRPDADQDAVMAFLNRETGPETPVLVVPTNLSGAFLSGTHCTYVGVYSGVADGPVRRALFALYPEAYPYPKLDFKALMRDYGLRFIVFSKRHCAPEHLTSLGLSPDLVQRPPGTPVLENAAYEVYVLQAIPGEAVS